MEYPMLGGLAEGDRRTVLAATMRRRYKRGDIIFHEGDLGDTFHLIDRGHVAVRTSTPDGDVATLTVLGPGEGFGEHAILDPTDRRSATAVAADAVETLTLAGAAFEELREVHPQVQRFLVDHLAERVRQLSQQLAEALYLPAEKRVLRRLLDLDALYDGGVVPFTQEDLATLAGTTRSTANRVLQTAVDAGLVALRRGKVEVLDRAALSHRAR